MAIRTNPELAAILDASTSQYDQVRALDTALTASKRIKARFVDNTTTPQNEIWNAGTLFRDAALTGNFGFSGANITSYGVTSDLTTALAADLETGSAVLRIEGGGHWLEGSLGLEGSGADFTLPANPTTTNSIAISGTLRLRANQALPNGTPDTQPPTISIASSQNTVTADGSITITATATDDIGVVKVEFYKNGVLASTRTFAPWAYADTFTYVNNGTVQYTARAYDTANNVGSSNIVSVVVDIPAPVETGTPVPIDGQITTITLQSQSGSTQSNFPVTLGQAFKLGELPASGAAVGLRAPDNSIVPCQLDVKATHPDGSVRHGVLSAIIPSLAANASVTYAIVRRASGPTGSIAMPADFPSLNATAVLTDTGIDVAGPNAGTTYTADCAPLLTAGTYETWLSGPIVSEWIVRVPLKTAGGVEHPDLHARFSIRAYAGQSRAKIDYVIENNWAKAKTTPSGTTPWESVSITDKIYRISLTAGGSTVFARATNGYQFTRLENKNASGGTISLYSGNATGLPNDATVYTATITVDGVAKPISITGSQAQTYGQLVALFNTQLGGAATCEMVATKQALRFYSATTGANSRVVITYGTLFPALDHVTPYRPVYGDEVIHYARTRWKKTFWWGSEPQVHIVHNKTYLMASKAVPNYDPSLTGSPSEIATFLAEMKANEDIGMHGITKPYMPDVGYSVGIGILPLWSAMYLINQGVDAKYIMLKQADLGGSWPIHLRDYDTDKPINFEKWPYAAFGGNTSDSKNPSTGLQEKLPAITPAATIPLNRNVPDTSHHPDMFFLPYLITGDHYYMEGLLFWQRYMALEANPHANYRDSRKGLWKVGQPRGQAWMLRTTVHTLYLLPNNHPLRADVLYQLEQNRIWYDVNYVQPTGQYHNSLGFIWHAFGLAYTVKGVAKTGGSPWMDDFITAACGRAVELGFTQMQSLFSFKARFPIGRLTSGSAFCWQFGAAYSLRLRDADGSPLYTNFGQVYQGSAADNILAATCGTQAMADALAANYSGTPATINTMTGYPSTIGSYPSNMEPAVAYCASLGMPGGADAWLVLSSRSVKPDYNLGPQFAIVPRT